MPRIILSLLSGLMLCLAPTAWAEPDPGFEVKETNNVKVIRNEDGSRSIFERSERGIRKSMYSSQGKLMSVTLYRIGKYNELRSCLIYDGNKNELFFVNYGYDVNGRLVEEQMRDSASKALVRRFIYTYDDTGNRSKPLCITLVKGKLNEQRLRSASPTHFDNQKMFKENPNS